MDGGSRTIVSSALVPPNSLIMFSIQLSGEALARHIKDVEARQQTLESVHVFQDRADEIARAVDHHAVKRLMSQAATSAKASQRVHWLQRAADEVGRGAEKAGVTPCKRGCSHCCHIPALVSRPEAVEIARVSGRKLATAPANTIRVRDAIEKADEKVLRGVPWLHHYGTPCPFLANDECSVWQVRPLVCRYHYSLDVDDLLCKVVDGQQSTQVPKLNAVANLAVSMSVLGFNQDATDIRDWFPDNSLPGRA